MCLYYANFSLLLVLIICVNGSNSEKDEKKLCPNQLETDKLRDEFTFIVHIIEKRYVGQQNGWRKIAKFLTFLAPNKRYEMAHSFCAKANETDNEKGQNDQQLLRKTKHHFFNPNQDHCLNKIFWPSNAELAKLKKANFFSSTSKYTEVAKMLEGMLKQRETLMAEIVHKALTQRGNVSAKNDENFYILAEIFLGRPKHEISAIIREYNEKFKIRTAMPSRAQLLDDFRQKVKKQQMYDYALLVQRIESIHNRQPIDNEKLVNSIFNECNAWRNWADICCSPEDDKCEIVQNFNDQQKQQFVWHGDEILIRMSKMNNLLRELMVFFEFNSAPAKYFATQFNFNCIELIKYMQKSPISQTTTTPAEEAKKNSFFKSIFKNNKQKTLEQKNAETRALKENMARANFGKIRNLLEISGLLETDSEYVYLAKTLNEANLKRNFDAVSRIIGLHVGTDMLKILEKFNTLPNRASISKTKFSGMFQVAYLEILKNTQDKCYQQFVEPVKGIDMSSKGLILQPVQQTATKRGLNKFANPNESVMEHKTEYIQANKNVLKNGTKNTMPDKTKNSIVSPNSSTESEDKFYSPENFEIDETPHKPIVANTNKKIGGQIRKNYEPQMPKAIKTNLKSEIVEENSSENEEQFYSPKFVADLKHTNKRENVHGINYLKMFNQFTSEFLEETMKNDWKQLKFSIQIADRFLVYLTEQVGEKILKRKWKILGHKNWCKPIENKQFIDFFEQKHVFNVRISNLQQKWKDIMPKINANFFNVMILFGINLADHRLVKMGEPKNRAEKKVKKKMLKMKTMLSNAFHCFPPNELDLNDNNDVHIILQYVMSRLLFVTTKNKLSNEIVIHVFQLVERDGQLHAESNDD